MIPYILNISIILVIIYRIYIGISEGLFNEFINLINFLFSAGISFTIFRSFAPYISKYIFPDEQYALIIAFWTIFMLSMSVLWSIKQLCFAKIYSATKEKTIPFLALVDKTGGAICGILLAMNLASCIIISLYIAPATKSLYNLREEDKIIFKTDEAYLKTYNKFIGFNWQEFLEELKPEEPPEEEVKEKEDPNKTKNIYY
jgi:uncharacterized membrane protein required for colicin V production